MTPFITLTATAVPLLRDNIDTDTIIPSREMKSTGKTGLADGLFAPWRYLSPDGRDPDTRFVLNQPRYADARILLGGSNFGCGSSREHAVWALAEYGIRANERGEARPGGNERQPANHFHRTTRCSDSERIGTTV